MCEFLKFSMLQLCLMFKDNFRHFKEFSLFTGTFTGLCSSVGLVVPTDYEMPKHKAHSIPILCLHRLNKIFSLSTAGTLQVGKFNDRDGRIVRSCRMAVATHQEL